MADYTIDPHAEYERIGAIYAELQTMIGEAAKAGLEQRKDDGPRRKLVTMAIDCTDRPAFGGAFS